MFVIMTDGVKTGNFDFHTSEIHFTRYCKRSQGSCKKHYIITEECVCTVGCVYEGSM